MFHLESPAGLIFPKVSRPDPLRCHRTSLFEAYRRHVLQVKHKTYKHTLWMCFFFVSEYCSVIRIVCFFFCKIYAIGFQPVGRSASADSFSDPLVEAQDKRGQFFLSKITFITVFLGCFTIILCYSNFFLVIFRDFCVICPLVSFCHKYAPHLSLLLFLTSPKFSVLF